MKKKLLRTALLFLLTSLGLAVIGCSHEDKSAQSASDARDDDEAKSGIVIRADIPDDKWKQILDILNGRTETDGAYPRAKLFRIKSYKPGSEPEELGALDEGILQDDFSIEPPSFKGHAVQIGLGVKPDFHRYPRAQVSPTRVPGDPQPTPPITLQAHFKQNLKESRIMVEKVDAILNDTSTPSPTP